MYEHLLEIGNGEGKSHPIFSSQYAPESEFKQVPDLVVKVDCTLTELFNGCNKTLTYAKKVLTKDGQSSQETLETKKIEILPGTCKDTPIIFAQQGNQ